MSAVLQNLKHYREDPIAQHVHAIVGHLGEDPGRAGLHETPKRFAKAMRALTAGYGATAADVVGNGTFPAEGDGVLVHGVEFYSLCEHHLLPFFGRMHVAYLPGERIIGLSKVPRLIELYSRRLQVQERLTEQVADALVETQHSQTATRALRGSLASDAQARQEILSMIRER